MHHAVLCSYWFAGGSFLPALALDGSVAAARGFMTNNLVSQLKSVPYVFFQLALQDGPYSDIAGEG